jgi:hypothetical protein
MMISIRYGVNDFTELLVFQGTVHIGSQCSTSRSSIKADFHKMTGGFKVSAYASVVQCRVEITSG